MLEALACGTPVAAHPVEGPVDVITDPKAGALNDDLGLAIEMQHLAVRASTASHLPRQHSWRRVADMMAASLVPARQKQSMQPGMLSQIGKS
jgi:glycosyltransferase involved in cell wall biosynthesis